MARTTLDQETAERSDCAAGGPDSSATPGLLLVWTGGEPAAVPLPLVREELEVDRNHPAFARRPDPRVSQRHAVVRCDEGGLIASECGSRNGTLVDGEPLLPGKPRRMGRVLRVGDSLLVPMRDLRPIERLGVRVRGERVEGPALQQALAGAEQAACSGSTLCIAGESGAGKEGIARAFHAAGTPEGRFVAVNCATIAEGVAERLLFGARRGAYSGADADVEGYLQAAAGGTLFLDEVAELSATVQAKLLRAVETGEVLPLGATRARHVALRFCSATHRDLRAQVALGKLREDLYFRIAYPLVAVPPLRVRPEEIAWLARAAASVAPTLSIHVSLIEACLLRPWPGNVRELLAEARSAAQTALTDGARRVEARHLGAGAGSPLAAPAPEGARPSRALIEATLRQHHGNISAAARALHLHRTQLRRHLDRLQIDPRAYLPSAED
jgi:DNA-binding NtrC family response regulator